MPELQGLALADYNYVIKRADKYHLKDLASAALSETVLRFSILTKSQSMPESWRFTQKQKQKTKRLALFFCALLFGV